MDQLLFKQTCDKIIGNAVNAGGIGTLGEKTLHAVLKNYYAPDETCHEVKISGFVADIAAEDYIIEIQTRQFDKLRKKLPRFLEQSDVTIVYPVARTKWLLWIDEETGAVTKRRKSPKIGQPYDILYELHKIKNLLCHPRLTLCIALIDLEEYRTLNGWSTDKKRGSTRYDRIPVALAGEVTIGCPADYGQLIPAALPGEFTSQEYKKAAGLSLSAAQIALNVLFSVGAVVRTGKRGNAYVYQRSNSALL